MWSFSRDGGLHYSVIGPISLYFCLILPISDSQQTEMLTTNEWCDLRSHLSMDWKALLYFRYSRRRKILVRQRALGRNIKSDTKGSWVNLYALQIFHSIFGHASFSILQNQLCSEKGFPVATSIFIAARTQRVTTQTSILTVPPLLGIQTGPIIWTHVCY